MIDIDPLYFIFSSDVLSLPICLAMTNLLIPYHKSINRDRVKIHILLLKMKRIEISISTV